MVVLVLVKPGGDANTPTRYINALRLDCRFVAGPPTRGASVTRRLVSTGDGFRLTASGAGRNGRDCALARHPLNGRVDR